MTDTPPGTTKKKKRLLVIGGSGDLGRALCARAVAAGYDVHTTYFARKDRIKAGKAVQLDMNNREAVENMLEEVQPEAIIHTAIPPANAPNLRQQIVMPAFHLHRMVGKESRLVLISTDMVFDGTKAPYGDDDTPSPLSAYGQAKAEMEMIGEYIVRTSLIYDFEPGSRQIDWMVEKIKRNEKVRLYADELRSAIWAGNLADVLLEFIDSSIKGILNVAGPEPISRLELGWQLLEVAGHDPEALVEAVSQSDSGRPADLTLDVSKAQMLLKTPLLTFEEALAKWRQENASETHSA